MPSKKLAEGKSVSPRAVIAPLAASKNTLTVNNIDQKTVPFGKTNLSGSEKRVHSNTKIRLANNINVLIRCKAIITARAIESLSPTSSNSTRPAPISASRTVNTNAKMAAFLILLFPLTQRKTNTTRSVIKINASPLVILCVNSITVSTIGFMGIISP